MKAPDTKGNQPGDPAALPARAAGAISGRTSWPTSPSWSQSAAAAATRSRRYPRATARSPSASTRAAGSCTSPSTSAADVIRAASGSRPALEAWAAVEPNGDITVGSGLSITHAGVGTYDVTVTAASCRNAQENAPVVSVDDSEPAAGFGPGAFPVAWTQGTGFTGKTFLVHAGVVVNGGFQPRDETVQHHRLVRIPAGNLETSAMERRFEDA